MRSFATLGNPQNRASYSRGLEFSAASLEELENRHFVTVNLKRTFRMCSVQFCLRSMSLENYTFDTAKLHPSLQGLTWKLLSPSLSNFTPLFAVINVCRKQNCTAFGYVQWCLIDTIFCENPSIRSKVKSRDSVAY